LRFEYGKREGVEYAMALSGAKINVSLARTATNRPHRTFDVMASRSCLLTSALPVISGEEREAGVHYAEFYDADSAMDAIAILLDSHEWCDFAEAGYALVREKHTWAVRATELRQIFYEVFKT
jgi:spore maturation protein CgeB